MASKDVAAKDAAAEEPKKELPVNHPQAGYLDPDLSENVGNQILPDEEEVEEEKAPTREENIAKREEEVEAVAEHEHEVAQAEAEAAAEAEEEAPAPEPQKAAATKESAAKS